MRNDNRTILRSVALPMLLLFAGLMGTQSCKKDDARAGGPPSIDRVRLSDPATKDSSLKQAGPGSTIVIVGHNLAGAEYVSFNGYKVGVNPAYATNADLVISIPDSVPTIANDPNVPNQIKVVTPGGEASYSFTILPPAPVLDHVSNEYAVAGQEITLYGKNFFFVDTVLLPGKIAVTTFVASPDGTALTVTIPNGTLPAQGGILVGSKSGWSQPARRGILYDHSGTGMILGWDALNSMNGILNFGSGLDVNSKVVSAYGGILPIDKKFAVIDGTIPANRIISNDQLIDMANGDGSIDNGNIFPAAPADKYDPQTPLANFDLKMEISATKTVGPLQLRVSQNNGGALTLDIPLANFIKSEDGKWYTVSANLGDLARSDGSKPATYMDLEGPGTLSVSIVNATPADFPVVIGIDNIRIVNVVN